MAINTRFRLWLLNMCFAVTVSLVNSQSGGAADASLSDAALQQKLTGIVERFFRAYEPQMQTEADAVGMSIEPFTQTSDFAVVIDGRDFGSFNDWVTRSPAGIKGHYSETKSSTHPISTIKFARLGDGGAVMTIFYRTYFSEANGKKGLQDAVVTISFREEEAGWKIVQYHGHHGEAVYTEE